MAELAAIQLRRIEVRVPPRKDTLKEPILDVPHSPKNREEERQLQAIAVFLVARELKRLCPSKEKQVEGAEEKANSEKIIWPKAQFLSFLDGDLFFIALKLFSMGQINTEANRLFSEFKNSLAAA